MELRRMCFAIPNLFQIKLDTVDRFSADNLARMGAGVCSLLSRGTLQLRKTSSDQRNLDVLAVCTDSGDGFRLKLLSQKDGPRVRLSIAHHIALCSGAAFRRQI